MKEITQRCSICKKTQCDGREFRVVYYRREGDATTPQELIVCSDSVLQRSNGTYGYLLVRGHGDVSYVEAFPLDATTEHDFWKRRALAYETAIRETLAENAHLADGDDCTLRKLKQVLADNARPTRAEFFLSRLDGVGVAAR